MASHQTATETPNNGYGAARLVREVYKDYTLSDMYIIKYNEAGGV